MFARLYLYMLNQCYHNRRTQVVIYISTICNYICSISIFSNLLKYYRSKSFQDIYTIIDILKKGKLNMNRDKGILTLTLFTYALPF